VERLQSYGTLLRGDGKDVVLQELALQSKKTKVGVSKLVTEFNATDFNATTDVNLAPKWVIKGNTFLKNLIGIICLLLFSSKMHVFLIVGIYRNSSEIPTLILL
jgi:hypothetical protein